MEPTVDERVQAMKSELARRKEKLAERFADERAVSHGMMVEAVQLYALSREIKAMEYGRVIMD